MISLLLAMLSASPACIATELVVCSEWSPTIIDNEIIDDEAQTDTSVNGCHLEVVVACNGVKPVRPIGSRIIDQWLTTSQFEMLRARPKISNSMYWHCRCSKGTVIGPTGDVTASCVVPAEMGNPDAITPAECR